MRIELTVSEDVTYKTEGILELKINPSIQTIPAIVLLVSEALQSYLHDRCHADAIGVDPRNSRESQESRDESQEPNEGNTVIVGGTKFTISTKTNQYVKCTAHNNET